ncbi:MAG: DnaJ domain-containing protein, partial [Thermodesulfobacteriota bacterium]
MKEQWGKLERGAFPRLLHTIYTEGDKTATLDVERQKIKKRFYFKKGVPVFAMSNQLSEVLGRLMVRNRVISQEVYEKTLKMVSTEKKRHGEILISVGAITPAQLDIALALQLKVRLWGVFAWPDGTYHYQENSLPLNLPKEIPTHPAYLILHGIKGDYYPKEMLYAETSGLLNKELIKTPDQGLYQIDDFWASPQEIRLLDFINSSTNLNEAIKKSGLSRERALPFLYTLLITNLLTLKEQKRDSDAKALLEHLTSEETRLRDLNYFDRLGISKSTDKTEIRKVFRNIAKKYHPDKFNRNNSDIQNVVNRMFTLLNEAYQTLRDDKRRKTYEECLKMGLKESEIDDMAANVLNAEVQFNKGRAALRIRKAYKEALEAFEWAVKMNPHEGEYKAYLGWALFKANPRERKKAMDTIRVAITLNPKQDMAYYFLGVLYRIEGNIKMARQLFQQALERNPYLAEARSELRLIQV